MIKAFFIMGGEDLSIPLAIRHEVFVAEQGFSPETERDDKDSAAVHIVVEEDGVPCGAGRLFYTDRVWHVGRMAVIKEKRGKGYGSLMVRMLADKALNAGVGELHIGAQAHAMEFYKKLGFRISGEEFDVEGTRHFPMVLTAEMAQSVLFGGCGGCEGGCDKCGGCKAR